MGCVHRSQQLFLAEQDPPAAQCCALGCGLGTSGLCWAVAHVQPGWRPQSCSQAWGSAIFPWQTPLPWLFPCSAPCSLFPPHFLTGTGAEPGRAGTASSGRGWAAPGGDTWLRLGLRRANKHIMTLQPGWAQEALSVTEPLDGSSLMKGCRR